MRKKEGRAPCSAFFSGGCGIHHHSVELQPRHTPPKSFASMSKVRPSPRAKQGRLRSTTMLAQLLLAEMSRSPFDWGNRFHPSPCSATLLKRTSELPLSVTGAGASRKLKPGHFLSSRVNQLCPLTTRGSPDCRRAFRLLIDSSFDFTLHSPHANMTSRWHHGIIC